MLSELRRHKSIIFILFIIYLLLTQTTIIGQGLIRFFPTVILLMIMFLGIPCCLGNLKSSKLSFLPWFLLYMTVNSLLTTSAYGNTFMTLLRSTYWISVYAIAWTIFRNMTFVSGDNKDNRKRDKRLFYLALLFGLFFLFIHSSSTIYIDEEGIGDNLVFYPLMLLPWLSTIQSKSLKWGALLLFFIIVIVSLKRSAFIVILSVLFLNFLFDFLYRKRFTFQKFLVCTLLLCSSYVVYISMYDRFDSMITRMEMMGEDGGNGRDYIYQNVWDRYLSGGFVSRCFGAGFDMVRHTDKSFRPVSAHNDFLEVLFDFGVVGLIFYLLIHLSLIKWTIRLFRARSQLAFPVLISYVCFLVMSMVSHLILYPTYFGLLVSFWAYAECRQRKPQYSLA